MIEEIKWAVLVYLQLNLKLASGAGNKKLQKHKLRAVICSYFLINNNKKKKYFTALGLLEKPRI